MKYVARVYLWLNVFIHVLTREAAETIFDRAEFTFHKELLSAVNLAIVLSLLFSVYSCFVSEIQSNSLKL